MRIGPKINNEIHFGNYNQPWPSSSVAPKFKPVFEEYHKQTWDLCFKIIRMIAKSLDLREDYFDDKFKNPYVRIRPVHYTNVKSKPD